MNVLNSGDADSAVSGAPEQLGRHLQQAMLQVKADHIGAGGRGVDYASLRSSTAFAEYVQVSQQLVHCDPTALSEEAKMAFFINIYNCLTIHGLASEEQLPASVLEVNKFWRQTAYVINGMTFTLDDIEHGVLRGNRPHPSADAPPFGEEDPRRVMAMKKCDPRIHFALVCGAKSCPAIQVYSEKNLERGLTMAARTFCSQEVEVLASEKKVRLNKIFMWYGVDFGNSSRELLQFVSKYNSGLEEILSNKEDDMSIEFKEYDWKLNKL